MRLIEFVGHLNENWIAKIAFSVKTKRSKIYYSNPGWCYERHKDKEKRSTVQTVFTVHQVFCEMNKTFMKPKESKKDKKKNQVSENIKIERIEDPCLKLFDLCNI